MMLMGFHMFQHLIPVNPGHFDIKQDSIEITDFESVDCLLPINGTGYVLITFRLKLFN